VSPAYAQDHAQDLRDPRTNGSGITAGDCGGGQVFHHIKISKNIVHASPGGGIGTCYADYITITGNATYRNAFWSPYAASGIGVWEMRDIDHVTGYKNFLVDNVSYDNREYIPIYSHGTITDGNGIIIDDNRNTQSNKVAYGGRTYVAHNVVYMNGGSGIHAYESQHVDIVYNTAYLNNQEPSLNKGQIFAWSSSDVLIMDNILCAAPGKHLYGSRDSGSSDVLYDYNILFNGTAESQARGPHDILADPLFVSPTKGDFHLRTGSPATGSGVPPPVPQTAIGENSRPMSDDHHNRGAY
jgi:hypothetical protein